jgi:hypothetical protein
MEADRWGREKAKEMVYSLRDSKKLKKRENEE